MNTSSAHRLARVAAPPVPRLRRALPAVAERATGVPIGPLVLGAAVAAAAALTFAFHALAGRTLVPGDYSSLGALLAVLLACAVPLTAVQGAVTVEVARRIGDREVAVDGRGLLRRVAVAAVLASSALTLAAPLLAAVLRLESTLAVIVAAWWLAANAPAAVGRGLLLGAGRLADVAASLAGGALLRLAAVVVLAPAFGLVGAVGASVMGELAAFLVALRACRRARLLEPGAALVATRWGDAGLALRMQVALWLFAGAAPILGRRALPAADVGAFAAMATAASACLFLPQAVATCALPRFVRQGSRRQLRSMVATTLGLGLLTGAPLWLAPQLVLSLLFGPGFHPQRSVMLLLCLHMAGLGVLGTLAQFGVARGHGSAAVMAAGLVTAAAAGEVVTDPTALAAVLCAATVPVVLVAAVRARRRAPVIGVGSCTS
ncbi:MAG: hypothetical protein AB7Q92_11310 [Acidimicrobiia bacterium]